MTKTKQHTSSKPMVNRKPDTKKTPPGFQKKTPLQQEMENSLRERLFFVLQNAVGRKVQVKLRNDALYSGIFYCAKVSDMKTGSGLDIAIRVARLEAGEPAEGYQPACTMVFKSPEWLTCSVVEINLNRITPGNKVGFQTDTEISGGNLSDLYGRELKTADHWLSDLPESSLDGLEDSKSKGSWNQFEANKKLFGVRSTFDENLYTTRLDKSKISAEKSREAMKIAREIEGQTSSNFHVNEERGQVNKDDGLDEEARYSSVIREETKAAPMQRGKNAYVPPSLRQSGENASKSPKSAGKKNPSSPMSYKAAATKNVEKKKAQSPMHSPKKSPKKKEDKAKVKTDLGTSKDAKNEIATEAVKKEVSSPKKTKEKESSKGSKLNPKAKEFKLSAKAASFTPSAGIAQQPPAMAYPSPHNPNPYMYPPPEQWQGYEEGAVGEGGYMQYGVEHQQPVGYGAYPPNYSQPPQMQYGYSQNPYAPGYQQHYPPQSQGAPMYPHHDKHYGHPGVPGQPPLPRGPHPGSNIPAPSSAPADNPPQS